jgi:hypothetical protein
MSLLPTVHGPLRRLTGRLTEAVALRAARRQAANPGGLVAAGVSGTSASQLSASSASGQPTFAVADGLTVRWTEDLGDHLDYQVDQL